MFLLLLQIVSTCERLVEKEDVTSLKNLLYSLSSDVYMALCRHEAILRAQVLVYFHQQDYQKMYALLENHAFSPASHQKLQQFWWEARYHEAQRMRGR